jgi:hypothetical protein
LGAGKDNLGESSDRAGRSPSGAFLTQSSNWHSAATDRVRHLGARRRQGQNVTFPARQFTVGGDRRSFSLLRYVDNPAAQDRLRDFLLQAYQAHEQKVEQSATT